MDPSPNLFANGAGLSTNNYKRNTLVKIIIIITTTTTTVLLARFS